MIFNKSLFLNLVFLLALEKERGVCCICPILLFCFYFTYSVGDRLSYLELDTPCLEGCYFLQMRALKWYFKPQLYHSIWSCTTDWGFLKNNDLVAYLELTLVWIMPKRWSRKSLTICLMLNCQKRIVFTLVDMQVRMKDLSIFRWCSCDSSFWSSVFVVTIFVV